MENSIPMNTNGLIPPIADEPQCPTRIQVGALRLKIEFVDDPSTKVPSSPTDTPADTTEKTYGILSLKDQTIYLANGQGPDVIADTLLHEVLHGLWSVVGGWAFNEIEEEKLVSMLTGTLLDTFRRNKELTRYLFQ